MFGYIKPDKDNLLVKELALYKATYCGLCAVIKKKVSFFLPFALSYDFVFLATVRAAISGDKTELKKGVCKYNPLKKCAFAVCNNQSELTAVFALILTALKLEDDIADKDKGFLKRLFSKPIYSYLSQRMKKMLKILPEYIETVNSIRNKLARLNDIEHSGNDCLDEACEIFGNIMAEITAYGFCGNQKAIATEIGSSVGRYIYLIDAIDDLEKDSKSGSYNPLLLKYENAKEAKKHFKELDVALAMYANRAVLAFELLEKNDYTGLIDNILKSGLGAQAYNIMTKNGDKDD